MSKTNEIVSKDYIFADNGQGGLVFKGNFEDYYKDVNDPWGQSAQSEDDMDLYYRSSRQKINSRLKNIKTSSILEVGCGLGYALKQITSGVGAKIYGTDISSTAIDKAHSLFPEYTFFVSDITKPNLKLPQTQFDVIILNQLLWYILPHLDNVVKNVLAHLSNQGMFIVSNAFAREQRYGKEMVDGFSGAVKYFSKCSPEFVLRDAQFSDEGYRVMDGIFVLEKKN